MFSLLIKSYTAIKSLGHSSKENIRVSISSTVTVTSVFCLPCSASAPLRAPAQCRCTATHSLGLSGLWSSWRVCGVDAGAPARSQLELQRHAGMRLTETVQHGSAGLCRTSVRQHGRQLRTSMWANLSFTPTRFSVYVCTEMKNSHHHAVHLTPSLPLPGPGVTLGSVISSDFIVVELAGLLIV